MALLTNHRSCSYRKLPNHLNHCRTPDAIFAAGIGPGSESKRSVQTAAPLAELLKVSRGTPFVTTYLRRETEPLVRDVLRCSGVVLICWQHRRIPAIARLIAPGLADIPPVWPENRFDLLWILERIDDNWRFTRRAQRLLAGDAAEPDD